MTVIARPNAWVAVEDDPATQLTYAPRVDPAPLTVSVPGRDPTLGSLAVVITNQGVSDLAVSSVTFTITVGAPGVGGTPLTPTTEGVKTLVSDTTIWSFTGPASPIASGTADYVLAPASGGTATLATGASVWVQIYDFETVPLPSTSQITVAEVIAGGDPAFTYPQVSTFPDGFYFDSLTVNVGVPSALVPVAQVVSGSEVTLTWNSSVVDTAQQTVYWSSPTAGQQHATPTKLGEWASPPLAGDTVFAVVVTAEDTGDEPLTAALATAVSVQNPAVVASSVQTGGLTVSGDAVVAGTLAASRGLTASAAEVSGEMTVNAAFTAYGAVTTNGPVAANGGLTASQAVVEGPLTAYELLSAAAGLTVEGGSWFASGPSDNYAIRVVSDSPTGLYIGATGVEPGLVVTSNNSGAASFGTWGANAHIGVSSWLDGASSIGFWTNGSIYSGTTAMTHVETRDGHRVVTSPLTLAPEVHLSGRARLSRGRATVVFEPIAADMIVHADDDNEYRVLVTPTSRCNGLAVTAKGAEGFEVEELLDGESDADFDWLVIARKRRELGSAEPDELPEEVPDAPQHPIPPEVDRP
ncbi:MAG: hypothetical protein M3340_05380 [Actinomycetota bacterium]|nr:hypothetical protein [Actinomycetota bacterium]